MAEKYPDSAAELRAELKTLETELRTADAAGDRRGALNLLARMLELQKRFMQRWARTPTPRGTVTAAAAAEDAEHDEPSAPPHELGTPGSGR